MVDGSSPSGPTNHMQFWILIIACAITAGAVTASAIRHREHDLAYGAMGLILATAALVIVALVFVR